MASTFPLTLRRCRDGLQHMPWLSLFGYAVLVIVYGTLLSLLLPAGWRRPFTRVVLVAPLLLVLAKDLVNVSLSLQRLRAASASGARWPQRLHALIPPEFPAYLRLERAMWRGLSDWVLQRRRAATPAGTPFGYLARGAYGTVICCALVALCVELPLDVLIASVMTNNPAQRQLLHGVFGVLAAYSFAWVLSDRWQVLGRGQHVLTAATLELDIGARGFGSIALADIAAWERLTVSRAAWCAQHGYALHGTRAVTPFDAPNLVLLPRPGCDVRLYLLQRERGGDSPIFLYVDRTESLGAALHAHLNIELEKT